MGENRKLMQIMDARPEVRGIIGRPRKTYMVGIEEIARKNWLRVTELRKAVGNRRDWRRRIKAA
jgi:hypothetical protein